MIFASRIDSHGKAVENIEIELKRDGNSMIWLSLFGERVNKHYVMPLDQLEDELVRADNEHREK